MSVTLESALNCLITGVLISTVRGSKEKPEGWVRKFDDLAQGVRCCLFALWGPGDSSWDREAIQETMWPDRIFNSWESQPPLSPLFQLKVIFQHFFPQPLCSAVCSGQPCRTPCSQQSALRAWQLSDIAHFSKYRLSLEKGEGNRPLQLFICKSPRDPPQKKWSEQTTMTLPKSLFPVWNFTWFSVFKKLFFPSLIFFGQFHST